MQLTVRLEGGSDLAKALTQLGKFALVKTELRRSMKTALTPVADTASVLAPKEFGDMADSIEPRTVPAKRGGRRGDLTMGVGPDQDHFYGMFHEFGWDLKVDGGTRAMPARPFLRPAWDQHRRFVLETMMTELWRLIRRRAAREARKAARLAKAA